MSEKAAAGVFISRGEDMIRFKDETGATKHLVDASGTSHGRDFVTDSGVSLSQLATTGLPSVIDCGTIP